MNMIEQGNYKVRELQKETLEIALNEAFAKGYALRHIFESPDANKPVGFLAIFEKKTPAAPFKTSYASGSSGFKKPFSPKPQGNTPRAISEAQFKRLCAMMHKANISFDQVSAYVRESFKYTGKIKFLPLDIYEVTCNWVSGYDAALEPTTQEIEEQPTSNEIPF